MQLCAQVSPPRKRRLAELSQPEVYVFTLLFSLSQLLINKHQTIAGQDRLWVRAEEQRRAYNKETTY